MPTLKSYGHSILSFEPIIIRHPSGKTTMIGMMGCAASAIVVLTAAKAVTVM